MSNPHPIPRKSSAESITGTYLRYKDKEKRKEYLRAYNSRPEWKEYKKNYDKKYKSSPERKERDWALFLKSEYGITQDDYNRMFEVQSGVCAICEKSPSGKKIRLCVDHDHSTGKVRGLLCDKCNRGLGLFGDCSKNIASALRYLRNV